MDNNPMWSLNAGGGRVPSPWNTSPELPSGWVGVPPKICYYPRVITQGFFDPDKVIK